MATHSFETFLTAALLTATAAAMGCSAQSTPEVPTPFVAAPQVMALGDAAELDPFAIAYDQANQAVALAGTAQTASEWATVSDRWETALKLMQLVPETSANYAQAQEKSDTYPNNFTDAQQQWATQLVVDAAGYLDAQGQWTDQAKGREIYDALKGLDSEIATDALVSQIRRPSHRKQVLFLSVKLGIKQSEAALVDALMNYGNEAMAEDFLNSGSMVLADGGERWAIARGYEVVNDGSGSSRTTWGRF